MIAGISLFANSYVSHPDAIFGMMRSGFAPNQSIGPMIELSDSRLKNCMLRKVLDLVCVHSFVSGSGEIRLKTMIEKTKFPVLLVYYADLFL